MKIKLDDVSGLPEALQSLVAETDDGHEIDLSRVAPADELDRFKSKAIKAEQEAIERRKALEPWKALGESPDAVREAIEASRKGKPSEDQERIVAEMRKEYEGKLREAQERLTQTYQRTAMSELKTELARAGVVPEGLDLLANYASTRMRFGEDGTPQIMAQDGSSPMIGSAANGGATLGDLAKDLAKSIPYLVKDNGAGGSGKQPSTKGGTPDRTVTRSQFDGMSQFERAEFSKSGGKVRDD